MAALRPACHPLRPTADRRPGRRPRVRAALAGALVAAALLGAAGPGRGEGPVEAAGSREADLLAEAASPFLRVRQRAVEELIAGLPATAEGVRRAFRAGGDDLRADLAPVLAAAAGPEDLRLLLAAYATGSDGLAAAARAALLARAEVVRAALPALRAGPPALDATPGARALADLEALLERDLVESTFLSRRSRSGGTGSYRGQFDVLKPWRETALTVCLHILRDWDLRLPGTYAAGGFRWLRPVQDVLDPWDARDLALTALGDLAQPGDRDLIARLEDYAQFLEALPSGYDDGPFEAEPERGAFYEGVLALLSRLAPQRWSARVRRRVLDLWGSGFSVNRETAAMLALKAGWYEEAVRYYQRLILSRDNTSPATHHYNLACAICQWSLEPGRNDPARLRERALDELTRAVEEGWLDLPWMQEDGDLHPIRSSPRFRALEERMRRALQLPAPPEPAAAPGGDAPAPGR